MAGPDHTPGIYKHAFQKTSNRSEELGRLSSDLVPQFEHIYRTMYVTMWGAGTVGTKWQICRT